MITIMKKIVLFLAAALLTAGLVSAQDLESATSTYNAGAEALQLGNKEDALKYFQDALQQAEACGEEGQAIVDNCKQIIPSATLSVGKSLYNAKDFDGAYTKIQEAAAVAKEYGDDATAAEAEALAPKVLTSKTLEEANAAFTEKDYATATPLYQQILAEDSTNKAASLRLVQCLANTGDLEGATEAYATAEANGQGANAAKVLSTAYLKQASADLKAGKNADAITNAEKANSYGENAQAYLVAGQAATKSSKTAEAIAYYEKYLELAPTAKNAGAIAYTVGALYQGQSNNTKAKEYYTKAKELGYADAQKALDALK